MSETMLQELPSVDPPAVDRSAADMSETTPQEQPAVDVKPAKETPKRTMRGHYFETVGVGSSCFITTTDDPNVVRKGYQVWENGRLYLRPVEYYKTGEEDIQREAAIYQVLGDHPHILKYFGLEEVAPGVHSLLLERSWMNNVRYQIIKHPEGRPDPKGCLTMALQVAQAVAFIHSKGVQHCDLSCRNILVFEQEGKGLHLKLADFGASMLEGRDFEETFSEEFSYQLPLRGRKFDDRPGRKRDLFALGSAIYEITSWQHPHRGLEDEEIEARFERGEYPPLEENITGPVILKCWDEGYETADDVATDLKQCYETLLVQEASGVPGVTLPPAPWVDPKDIPQTPPRYYTPPRKPNGEPSVLPGNFVLPQFDFTLEPCQ